MILPISEIASILGRECLPRRKDDPIDTLLTDSRSLTSPSTSLFFAISTAGGNDGHLYMRSLYDTGVRHFVASRIPADMEGIQDADIILVDDPVAALQKIASRHPGFHGRILAITGSRGKTTLKEWLVQLMEQSEEVARSPRSSNSRIGVPLSLWEIEPSTTLAIIEAGISARGEMTPLRDCISPDVVVFTNLCDDHDEGFDSMQEKAAEKAVLATSQSVRDVVLCLDNSILAEAVIKASTGKKLTTWTTKGVPEADIMISCPAYRADTPVDVEYTVKGKSHRLKAPVADDNDLQNLGSALAFMTAYGLEHDDIATRFKTLRKTDTRMKVSEGVNGCDIIYDSYTSDNSSLGPALDFMRRRAADTSATVVIVSDMIHESAGGSDAYASMARTISLANIGRVIGIGPEISAHAGNFRKCARFFASTDEFMKEMSPSDFSKETILLKGAPRFEFGRILEMLEARKHETVLEVNLDAIVRNFNYFRRNVPRSTGIVAMVKASGYGAGSYEIAKTLQDCGAAYLAVAVLDEGIELRKKGIHLPIMVMNPKVVNYRSMFSARLEPVVYNMEMLSDVIREGQKNGVSGYPVHIKVDTGMHRTGFIEDELPALMDILESHGEVRIKSVFSHLATADCPDMNDYTELQLSRFARYTDYIQSRTSHHVLRHVLNSAGILRYPQHHYDMVRLGIGIYGVNTLPPEMEKQLDVVSSLKTIIIALREWEAGETIGYGRKGVLKRRSRIATIPIGYADGMNRHFGCGAIKVKVNGHDAPTVGNICMDACMIDVTDIDCRVGDSVEIFGAEAPIKRLSDVLDTIPYEILTSVSPRVKRIYFRE